MIESALQKYAPNTYAAAKEEYYFGMNDAIVHEGKLSWLKFIGQFHRTDVQTFFRSVLLTFSTLNFSYPLNVLRELII